VLVFLGGVMVGGDMGIGGDSIVSLYDSEFERWSWFGWRMCERRTLYASGVSSVTNRGYGRAVMCM